jgi:pyruvate formate lyase activating enzyme
VYPASHYRIIDKDRIRCQLCPHFCVLEENEYGLCHARVNLGGELRTASYGILSALSADPVEKKPLYHFYPGKPILSAGGFGCNLSCSFCQNCEISQTNSSVFSRYPSREPENVVQQAAGLRGNIGLAYTYNEPTIFFEFMVRCAALIHDNHMKNVMVTNGFINKEPLEELLPVMDAFNVDLKSYRDEFYKHISGGRLKPVLDTIERIAKSERHLELTFLIVPGLNDTELEWNGLISWISDHCGPDTVLHVSRYYPHYRLNHPPTPVQTIQRFMDAAKQKIRYVYPGNTRGQLDSNTYCPSCYAPLIERDHYFARVRGIDPGGLCSRCHEKIYGIFN